MALPANPDTPAITAVAHAATMPVAPANATPSPPPAVVPISPATGPMPPPMPAPTPRLAAPIPAVLGRQRVLELLLGASVGGSVQLVKDAGAGMRNTRRSAGRTCKNRHGGCSGNPHQSSQKRSPVHRNSSSCHKPMDQLLVHDDGSGLALAERTIRVATS